MLSQAGSLKFQSSHQSSRALQESQEAGAREEAALEGSESEAGEHESVQ